MLKFSGLGIKQTLNKSGEIVTPGFPFKLGNGCPSGNLIVNVCIIDAKKRNSSYLASTSPKHILLPTPNGMKYSGF